MSRVRSWDFLILVIIKEKLQMSKIMFMKNCSHKYFKIIFHKSSFLFIFYKYYKYSSSKCDENKGAHTKQHNGTRRTREQNALFTGLGPKTKREEVKLKYKNKLPRFNFI